MPKLLRGSSLSSEDKGRAEGAGTAADCTERAGDSSLELLLESLQQERRTSIGMLSLPLTQQMHGEKSVFALL